MKKSILLIVPLFVTLNAQNLKTTVEEVLTTNPIVLERLENFNSTKTDITVAKAGYYPQLNLKLGLGVENFDDDKQTPTGETLDVYTGSLIYTQNLFKGFETSSQIDAQKNRSLSAAYSYIEKANDTSFEMVNKYLEVIKNKELVGTAEENIKIDTEILEKVQKLYKGGLTTLSEVNKIESSLSLAKTNLMVQKNTLRDAEYSMQRVLGRGLELNLMSKPTVVADFPATFEEAIDLAKKNNPSIIVANYNIKLAKATKTEKKSTYYPSLDLELSASRNENFSGVDDNTKDDLKAMAYLSYNIFNGFSDKASIQKSETYLQQEIQNKYQLEREVTEGMSLSWVSYSTLQDQITELQEYKRFSLRTLELYSKEYDLGRRSLLDLLSAQNDFIGAKAKIITTSYNLLLAKYRVLDAMGTLVPAVIGDDKAIYNNVNLKETN